MCHDVDDHRAGTNVFDIDENNTCSHDEDNTPVSNARYQTFEVTTLCLLP